MLRSVAEVLPRRFADLTVDDVVMLANAPSDERETLYLEFKGSLTEVGIAKSCAAFANTVGGLLVVGVDKGGEVVGVDRRSPESQIWVKDILRPRA